MKTTVAAIDFGTSKIVTLIAEHSNAQRCNIVGAGIAAYDGYLGDGWNNPDELNDRIVASISDAEQQCRHKVREISVGVPAMFTKVYATEVRMELKGTDPTVTSKDIQNIFKQAEQELELENAMGVVVHSSPAWFQVDEGKKSLEPVGMKGRQLRAVVSFVVADKFFVDEVNQRLSGLNYIITGFYSTAAGESMFFLPEGERDRTAVLIDMGYLSTDVMVVEGDALMYTESIDMGGGNITADLSMGLDIPMKDAEERIKRKYVFNIDLPNETYEASGADGEQLKSFTRQEVSDVILPRVDEIAEAIQKALENSCMRGVKNVHIYLTGGGLVFNRGGKDYLGDKLGGVVREVPKRTTNLNSHSYSSALGLMDLIISTMEQNHQQSAGAAGPVKSFFRSLFGG